MFRSFALLFRQPDLSCPRRERGGQMRPRRLVINILTARSSIETPTPTSNPRWVSNCILVSVCLLVCSVVLLYCFVCRFVLPHYRYCPHSFVLGALVVRTHSHINGNIIRVSHEFRLEVLCSTPSRRPKRACRGCSWGIFSSRGWWHS